MRLPNAVTRALGRALIRRVAKRAPDVCIGGADNPYMRRWFVIPRNRVFNIYLHEFCRSDDDRALHDHPWINLSVLLAGGYHEMTYGPENREVWTRRCAGDLVLRLPSSAHRIALIPYLSARPWTLFITGPRVREWGFLCPQGWRHWRDFVARNDPGSIGPGCD